MSPALVENFTDAEVEESARRKGETLVGSGPWTVHSFAWRGLDVFELWRNYADSEVDAVAKARDLHYHRVVVRSEVKDSAGNVVWSCDKRRSHQE